MIYPIVKYGDPVLETPAAAVTAFDDKLKKLVADMFESMYEAQGVGLAAPQIGISLRLSVIDTSFKEDPAARLVLANPQIIKVEGKVTSGEGCLSLPDFRENLARGKRSPSGRRTQTATGTRRPAKTCWHARFSMRSIISTGRCISTISPR